MSANNNRLIEQCQQGDVEALEWLYIQYSPTLLGVCRRYVNNTDIAEDIVHECFIIIFDKIKDLKNRDAVEGWMKRIVVNYALKHLKKQSSFYDIEEINEKHIEADKEETETGDIKEQLLRLEIDQSEVMSIIDELPPRFKAVFNLYVFENKSHQEIAKELDITPSTSRSQLVRARKLIQKKMIALLKKQEKDEKVLFIIPFVMREKLEYIDEIVKGKLTGLKINPGKSFNVSNAIKSTASTSAKVGIQHTIINFFGKTIVWSSLTVVGITGIIAIILNNNSPQPDTEATSIVTTDSIEIKSIPKVDTLKTIHFDSIKNSPTDTITKSQINTIHVDKIVREKVMVRKVIKMKKSLIVKDTIQKLDSVHRKISQ